MSGDLYEAIDEVSGGTDSIYVSHSDDSGEEATFTLGNVTDPADHTNHKVVVNAYVDDEYAGSVTLNINLKQGTTSLKNQDFSVAYSADESGTDYTMVLASTDIDTELTDYTDLNLVITATDTSGGAMITSYVNRAWFECPDAGSPAGGSPVHSQLSGGFQVSGGM
jgi:2',3'-cyclic-nucleotide 2'-phosphodiesterase (5'-nucleotidase family)